MPVFYGLISPVVTCCTFSQSRVSNSDRRRLLCHTFLHFLWLPHHNHMLKEKKIEKLYLVNTNHTSRISSGLENNSTVNSRLEKFYRLLNPGKNKLQVFD